MAVNLRVLLPLILPKAIAWAEAQSAQIAHSGYPLDDSLISLAHRVGVLHPERIRILEVDSLPMPDDQDLRQAALETGLLGANAIGLTLAYGIYVRRGHRTPRLLAHEFRHVHQYENSGSIAAFLPVYLQQVISVGYENAPLEIDARAHEKSATY